MTTTPSQNPANPVPVRYIGPPTPQALADRLGIPIERLCKLDANESPYGPPPSALAALVRFASSPGVLAGVGRYPDPVGHDLRDALARYTGAAAERIVIGNGSDELIALLAELMIDPGDEVIVAEPTFGVYAVVASRRGAQAVDVGRAPDFSLDAERVTRSVTERTRAIILCGPNNPTGTPLPRETLLAVLEQTRRPDGSGPLIVLDEAYYEFGAFADEPGAWTAAPLVAEHDRLVVLRTFSKLFGLAGLRVGYAICPPDIAAGLRERKQPFNVNRAGLVAARAALDDMDWLAERARAIVAERERLARALTGLPGLRVFPSAANFLLMETLNGAAQPLWEALLDRGIMLRRFSSERQAQYLRVTSGMPEENDRFLTALTELVSKQGANPASEETEHER